MKNKRLIGILLGVALILMIPLLANWPWDSFDFIVMGVLLLVTGLGAELVMRKVTKTKHRVAIIVSILLLFLFVWAELAVGIVGSPFAGS